MNVVRVPGSHNGHKVFMYALSTCVWCKMTKQFLRDNDVEYEYVDADLSSDDDKERIRSDMLTRGGPVIYPTIFVDDTIVISGPHKEKIREAIGF